MEKLIIIMALTICVSLVKAEGTTNEIIILQNSKVESKFEIFRNAKLGEATDDSAKKMFALQLGGINDESGGSFYIRLPKEIAEFNADAIEIELKGNKDNNFAPVLLTGNNEKVYYCWKGHRSSWEARMPVFKNEWQKYTFYAKDFQAQNGPDKKLKDFNGSTWLSIAIGSEAKIYKETVTIMISSIRFKRAQTE